MNTELHLYRTTELTSGQIRGICALFQEIFYKQKSEDFFRRQSLETCLGYSYHCLAELNGEVVGAFSCIPYLFRDQKEDRQVQMAVCVDAMISKRAKLGPLGVRFMFDMLKEAMAKDGIEFVYSFPNDHFYPYNLKVLGMRDIGILDFYVLPMSVGLARRGLTFLNPVIREFSFLMVQIGRLWASKKVVSPRFEIVDSAEFRHHRYDERHTILKLALGADAVATLYRENFGPVAYLLDVRPLSAQCFYRAIKETMRQFGKEAALVAFPSQKLPFGNLFRAPRKWLPRKLHMVGCFLDENRDDREFFDLVNWKSNLSIFDVR